MSDITRTYNRLTSHNQAWLENARELKERDPLAFSQLFSFPSLKRIAIPSMNGFGWMSLPGNPKEYDKPKLKLFHHLSQTFKIIQECDYDETFEPRFIDGKIPKGQIICKDSATLIAILFRDLQRKRGISEGYNLYEQLTLSFLDKNLEPLNSDSLEKMASRGISKQKQERIYDLLLMLFA